MRTIRAILAIAVVALGTYALTSTTGTAATSVSRVVALSPSDLGSYSGAPSAVSNAWDSAATMPTARTYLATVAKGSFIYALGGIDNATNNRGNENEAFNPVTNSWTSRAPMPTGRSNLAATLGHNGLIYAIGGVVNVVSGGDNAANQNEAYNTTNNSWTTKAPLPTARFGMGAATGSNGLIYVVGGGLPTGEVFNVVEVYNPMTNSWMCSTGDTNPGCTSSTIAPLPRALGATTAVAVGSNIYVLGGYDRNGNPVNDVYAYSPTNNAWTAKAPMPTARYLTAAVHARSLATDGDQIYVLVALQR